jgi:hypothetical protein
MARKYNKYNTDEERKAASYAHARKWQKANPKKFRDIIEKSVQKRGFKDFKEYIRTTPSYLSSIKGTEPNKFKTEAVVPNNAKEIPNIPGYFVTPDARIFKYSDKRKMWLEITQQKQKSGYCVFQPYIDGKKCVRFVHIAMCETFISLRPSPNHQVDHIDHVRNNNNITNLQWLTQSANLKRRPKWTNK